MQVIRAPDTISDSVTTLASTPSIFLAGGITNCPDWQATAIEHMQGFEGIVFNPRRENWSLHDKPVQQIEWEHAYMTTARVILFWFPEESICPIALFELGIWLNSGKALAVGCHPKYPRRVDIRTQTRLHRRQLTVWGDLEDVIVKAFVASH